MSKKFNKLQYSLLIIDSIETLLRETIFLKNTSEKFLTKRYKDKVKRLNFLRKKALEHHFKLQTTK